MLAPVLGEKLAAFGNIRRWLDVVGARPAGVKGMAVPAV
jgi:hypothetical protein